MSLSPSVPPEPVAPPTKLAPIASSRWPAHWRALTRLALRSAFAIGIVGFVVIGAYLLAPQISTLAAPAADDPAPAHSVAQRSPSQRGWLVLHVLDEEYQGSLRVLDHLLAGPRPVGVDERVVLIARTAEPVRAAAIRAHGFDLDVVAPEQLGERYHLSAAPLLVIVDPADNIRYLGGYTPRNQASDVCDIAIITAVIRGERVPPLPGSGSAVDAAPSDTVDPLGIREY